MKKGRLFVGGLVVLTVAAVWIPDLRLAHELGEARKEGLWTTAAEVRRADLGQGPDAADLVRKAGDGDRRLTSQGNDAIQKIVVGHATSADRASARSALVALEPVLALWWAASLRPRLTADRNYEDGFGVLYPEFGPLHGAVNRLVAAARLGLAPRENLLAAARLSALLRREPGVVPAAGGATTGLRVLHAARPLGLGREVEAALGPPSDVRRVLGPELPAFLLSADYGPYTRGVQDLGLRTDLPFAERAMHYGPLARNTKAAGIARWRVLWARIPKDGRDYDGAARVVDEELPKLDVLMPSYADVMAKLLAAPGDPGRGGFLREIGAFERERAKVRAGG